MERQRDRHRDRKVDRGRAIALSLLFTEYMGGKRTKLRNNANPSHLM